ncbi:class I adenylate-forming enzyme family protein [Microbacterium alcoholitolerans]|uniref:class I adenylate-forming enzyme family protein n=1 Tax=unclassified Microbacterium TaxID=2609290 RepID=UPI003D183791
MLRAGDFGDAVAIRAGEYERTYRELVERCTRLAHHLLNSGLRAGDCVAIMVEDGLRAIEPHLACALAGLVIVPVNARFRSSEVEHIIVDSGARAVIHSAGVFDVLQESTIPDVMLRVSTGGAHADDTSADYESCVTGGSPCPPPTVAISPDDLVMIGYTSGTTGRPKGAMMTNASGIAAIRANVVAFRVVPYGACAFSGSVSFTALFWAFIAPHLFLGASIDFLQPNLTIERWFERMERFQSTFTFVPTPYMNDFAVWAKQRPEAITALSGVCHSASAATPEQRSLMLDALGSTYIESFGMTESLAAVCATTRMDSVGISPADDLLKTIGRAIAPANVYAVADDGSRLGPGDVGELVIESPSLFVGYWQNRSATQRSLSDGRYWTGDIGHVDAHGYVYIDGRKSELIISGGMNVYPAEIEAVLQSHPGVSEAAVLGIPHARWGESVAAAVVLRPGFSLDDASLIRHVSDRLASYKKPTSITFVDALPRNANLKVLKAELAQFFTVPPPTVDSPSR